MAETKIYKMHKGIDAWFWLCPKHLASKKRQKWELQETRDPPHTLECEECRFERGEFRHA